MTAPKAIRTREAPRRIVAVDLFCGGGGSSSGLLQAAAALGVEVDLLAINHWDVAIETHQSNHPTVRHICKSVESVHPAREVPGGKLHLLMASPECTHHSNARGGKPMSDQARATAWHILHWLEVLDVENVLIENVTEFRSWGPLHGADHPDSGKRGRPIEKQKGRYFRLFLRNLAALGYRVEERTLNAAHYGDATTRQRLFILARKGRRPIRWPEPSHLPPARIAEARQQGDLGLMRESSRPWRAAREIIDWSLPGESIFGRRRPLAENTLARIYAGLRKYCGLPFLLPYRGEHKGQGARTHSLDKPMPTVTTYAGHALIEPFLVVLRNHCDARSVEEPVPTVAAQGGHMGLCEPFLFTLNHGAGDLRSYALDHPMPTVTTVDAWGLAEPFLLPHQHGSDGPGNVRSVDEPAPTITGSSSDIFLAQPFLVKYFQGSDAASVDDPLPTVTANYEHLGLARPFLIHYHGSDERAHSVDAPLGTITARDRFALIEPRFYQREMGAVVGFLDVRFRMLQPKELAAAMSFPAEYQFHGTREQQVRQIGNAVAVSLARALCTAILSPEGG